MDFNTWNDCRDDNMKLWNELTEEEQKAIIDLAVKISEVIETEIVDPLVECFNGLSRFFALASKRSYWLCTKCGTEEHYNDDFCANCGEPD